MRISRSEAIRKSEEIVERIVSASVHIKMGEFVRDVEFEVRRDHVAKVIREIDSIDIERIVRRIAFIIFVGSDFEHVSEFEVSVKVR